MTTSDTITRRAALAGAVTLPVLPVIGQAQGRGEIPHVDAETDPVAKLGEQWQALLDEKARLNAVFWQLEADFGPCSAAATDYEADHIIPVMNAMIGLELRMGDLVPTTPAGIAAQLRAAFIDKDGCCIETESDGREGRLLRAALAGAERLAGRAV